MDYSGSCRNGCLRAASTLREARAAQSNAENGIAVSAEHGLADFLAWATTLRGWAVAEQGRPEEGIVQIQEGLIASRDWV